VLPQPIPHNRLRRRLEADDDVTAVTQDEVVRVFMEHKPDPEGPGEENHRALPAERAARAKRISGGPNLRDRSGTCVLLVSDGAESSAPGRG
jgi:hypothetical protein